ncbi:MAG: hypothetical protein E4H03_08475 [Myxococcales bacterium]|nr:MAG: hypothetical protein E4H03_08475 [Myxococcales bacterium]
MMTFAAYPQALVLTCLCLIASACAGDPRPPCDSLGEIPTLCGLRNPEDLAYAPDAGIVIVSSMRWDSDRETAGGFLSAVTADEGAIVRLWPPSPDAVAAESDTTLGDPGCTEPPEANAFYPHGIAVADRDNGTFVYVVGHRGALGGREAVEIFKLAGRRESAKLMKLIWKACVPTPGAVLANDVAPHNDGGFIASNYLPDRSLWHTIRSALLGTKTGNVIRWRPDEGWSEVDNTESALANGVALTRDGETLFYTETMTGKLYRLRLDAIAGRIAVDIGGNPDGLTWTSRGTLLVATHTSGSVFMLCALGKRPCTTGWAVYEVDPVTLATSQVLEHDGSELGAVATALEANGVMYLGSVYDDRIGAIPLTH